MKPKIDPEFRALIPPAPASERAALEAALVRAGGATDALLTWRGIIVDGHTRLEICERLGLSYETRELSPSLPDRAAVKAWILENQCARRNLTRFQRIVLLAMNGAARPPYAAPSDWSMALRGIEKGFGPDVVAGRIPSFRSLKNRVEPPPPRPPRGPTEPRPQIPPMHEGHELSGVSTLTGPNGEVRGAWNKTRVAGAKEPPTPLPETFHMQRASLMQRGDGSTVIQWSSYSQAEVDRFESIKAAIVEHVAMYVPPAGPVLGPPAADADLITLYPLGDPHVGMMAWAEEVGESFDLKIAERELVECMRQLVARSPSAATAIITNLGDFWHAQDDQQRTPKSGHKLDVDGRAGKVGRVGLRIMTSLVDVALAKHDRVIVRSIPGNHDPHSAFWLPEYLGARYAHEPRVAVKDAFNPYQYDTFGGNLFGWAHGDGAKIDTLGEIMATDVPDLWGAARFRYWNTGHVHHWSEKELRGCLVTTHRTLAGRDAWTHHSGYRSGRALKAITYHREWGLDSVAVVGVERVRAAVAA